MEEYFVLGGNKGAQRAIRKSAGPDDPNYDDNVDDYVTRIGMDKWGVEYSYEIPMEEDEVYGTDEYLYPSKFSEGTRRRFQEGEDCEEGDDMKGSSSGSDSSDDVDSTTAKEPTIEKEVAIHQHNSDSKLAFTPVRHLLIDDEDDEDVDRVRHWVENLKESFSPSEPT